MPPTEWDKDQRFRLGTLPRGRRILCRELQALVTNVKYPYCYAPIWPDLNGPLVAQRFPVRWVCLAGHTVFVTIRPLAAVAAETGPADEAPPPPMLPRQRRRQAQPRRTAGRSRPAIPPRPDDPVP